MNPPTDMDLVANAFGFLGRILKINGRRKLRAECEIRMHMHRPDENNAARRVAMLPRAQRRKRIVELRLDAKDRDVSKRERRQQYAFRPVIGHAISAPDHKAVVWAMKSAVLVKRQKPGTPIGVEELNEFKNRPIGKLLPESEVSECST